MPEPAAVRCARARRLGLTLSCLAMAVALPAAAQSTAPDISRAVLVQGRAVLPHVRLFVDVAKTDESSAEVPASALRAKLGPVALHVDRIVPFSSSELPSAYVIAVDTTRVFPDGAFGNVQAALKSWIGELRPDDRVALVEMGEAVAVRQAFTRDVAALAAAIDALAPRQAKAAPFETVAASLDLFANGGAELPERRGILLLSDGHTEEPPERSDAVTARVKEVHVPIYTIGYSLIQSSQRGAYLGTLRNLSTDSGGAFIDAGDDPQAAFARAFQAIRRVKLVELTCLTCSVESPQNLDLAIFAEGQQTPPFQTVVTVPVSQNLWYQIYRRLPPGTPPWLLRAVGAVELLLGLILLSVAVRALLPRSGTAVAASPYADELNVSYQPFSDQASSGPAELDGPVQRSSAALPSHDTPDAQRGAPAREGTVWAGAPQPHASRDDRSEPRAQPGSGLPLALRLVAGRLSTERLHVQSRVILGREPGCDVVTDDPEVSKQHLCFLRVKSKIVVEDLNSSNGTYVNGIKLSGRHVLDEGDRIAVGRTEFVVVLGG